MPRNDTYNGWANYQTWVVALYLRETFDAYVCELFAQGNITASIDLARLLSDFFDETTSEFLQAEAEENALRYLVTDLLRSAIDEICWQEIAESCLEQYDNQPN